MRRDEKSVFGGTGKACEVPRTFLYKGYRLCASPNVQYILARSTCLTHFVLEEREYRLIRSRIWLVNEHFPDNLDINGATHVHSRRS